MDHPPPTWIPALIAATLATGIAGCGSAHTTTTRNATSTHLSVSAYEAQIVPKINHLVSVPQAPLGDARRPAKIKAYAIAARLDFGQAIKLMNSIKPPTTALAPQRQLIAFLRAESTAFEHALAASPVDTHAIINYAYTHEVGQLMPALYAVTK
jgi:hypothetical protein